jgi:hypothetical protein
VCLSASSGVHGICQSPVDSSRKEPAGQAEVQSILNAGYHNDAVRPDRLRRRRAPVSTGSGESSFCLMRCMGGSNRLCAFLIEVARATLILARALPAEFHGLTRRNGQERAPGCGRPSPASHGPDFGAHNSPSPRLSADAARSPEAPLGWLEQGRRSRQ